MENLKPIDLRKKNNWTVENAESIAEKESFENNEEFKKILALFILEVVDNSKRSRFLPQVFISYARRAGITKIAQ